MCTWPSLPGRAIGFHELKEIDDDGHVSEVDGEMQREPTVAIGRREIALAAFDEDLEQVEPVVETAEMHERLPVVFQTVEIDVMVVDAARFEKENLDGVRVAVVKNGVEETMGELMTVEYHASLSRMNGETNIHPERRREGEREEGKEKQYEREREEMFSFNHFNFHRGENEIK